MFGIGDFFKKIQNSYAREIFLRTVIKDVLKKHIGAEIVVESISFNGSVVVLQNVSQAVRSAVYIKKIPILNDINSAQDMRRITDIK